MQRREADRPKGFNDNSGRAQFLAMSAGNVDGAEGVVEDEYAYARLGAFAKILTERVGHAPGAP